MYNFDLLSIYLSKINICFKQKIIYLSIIQTVIIIFIYFTLFITYISILRLYVINLIQSNFGFDYIPLSQTKKNKKRQRQKEREIWIETEGERKRWMVEKVKERQEVR